MFVIDRHVPLPPKGFGRLVPLKDMAVGDSVSVDKEQIRSVRTNVSIFQRKNPGVKFMTRRNQDGESYRLWRVV